MDQLENGWKAIRVVLIFGRKVASSKKGLEIRRQEQIVGPSARARQKLPSEHKDRVDIGPLFPINLDVDKPFIHQRGDSGIRIDGSLGHVEQVAGDVDNRVEDRIVYFSV